MNAIAENNSSAANKRAMREMLRALESVQNPNQLCTVLGTYFRQQFDSVVSLHLNSPVIAYASNRIASCSHYDAYHNKVEIKNTQTQPVSYFQNELMAGIALYTGEQPLGSLILSRQNAGYSPAEIEQLEALAPTLALGIRTILLNWQQEIQQRQLGLIASVTSQLAHITKLDVLAREICRLILTTFNYYYVALFTLESESNALMFRASARSPQSTQPPFEIPAGMRINLGEHIVGFVAREGETLLANDVSHEPRYGHLESLPETKAEIAIPLKIGETVLGVLDVQSDQKDVFQKNDQTVLSVLADSLALAIHRVRLYSDLEERKNQLDTIADVAKSISSLLDLDQLLDRVVTIIHDEFNYPHVNIFLVDYVQKKIEFKTGAGKRAENYRKYAIAFPLDADQGIIPFANRNKQVLNVPDVSKDFRYKPSPFSRTATGSELAIPLVFAGEAFGVLDIQSDSVSAFDQSDVELLTTLSANVSIALRNAKLYNSEKWRRKVAENLQDVAALLSENLDLNEILATILSKIEEILPCDLAAIWQLENPTDSDQTEKQVFSLSAMRSINKMYPPLENIYLQSDQAWFTAAMTQETPLIRQQSQLDDPFFQRYQFAPDFSAIAAPLVTAGKNLGILTLHHHSPYRYGKETQNITASFAGYTGIAIENARLAQESQDQAWISTILLQVAKATQSLTSIGELTNLSGQMIKLLIGGKDGAVLLTEPDQNSFYIHSVFGETFPFLGLNFPLGIDKPCHFAEVTSSRLPTAFPASQCEPAMLDLLRIDPDDTVLLLPLVAHDELLGVLMHVSNDPYQPAEPEKVLGKQKYAILQGIAQQIAVSIQNINLLDARQEETYISAVLLQVSQTIVSTPRLTEALDKVSYILQMLAGVEACATFQYLPDQDAYQLLHAVSDTFQPDQLKNFMGKTYPKNDLTFLSDGFDGKPYLLKPEVVFAGVDIDGTQISSETVKANSTPDIPQKSVYMVFHLAVRSEEYGVLLCRDPDLPKRERRLELLNGVAQQISFAFQNERLQQARSQQERLDQEFQLAREIQETFLPEKLPQIPGYALEASWQTARQVGGDFYDAFEIRPGLFGLAIADVSDKGLAAALYMTVSRTLLRAAALESASPAKTLERVNELLQIDSKRGFFVTCLFAILEQSTGKLVYANAGHLPLIHLNLSAKTVTGLNRGGIALGVLEHVEFVEHMVQLNPGDGLVFFTDGITEAYNNSGTYYGDRRYRNLLRKALVSSPKEIIARVEEDFSKFRKDTALSDDVTQLILKRNGLLTD